ncbi:MmgE/PrpD family protein [Chloroflexota bacterium]
MTISENLAQYVHELSFSGIPEQAKKDCKRLILDSVGVAIGGSGTKLASIAVALAREFADKRESTVIGGAFKTSCLNAAFANGIMSHALDFDDDYEPGSLHAGCAIIPVALAIGEAKRISGGELITAITAGYDVSCRVAFAILPQRHARRPFHASAVANPFGAAAAAGKILKLNKAQLVSAFGLAGDQASGLLQYHHDGTMIKQFHAGKAAQNGLLAALLAQREFTGPPEIFEGEFGFCNFMSPDDCQLAELTRGLARDFRVSATSIKPFPSCRMTHSPIEAALILKEKYNIAPDEIDKVIIRTFSRAFKAHNKPSPDTVLQSILSEQYNIATALVKGKVDFDDFTPEAIHDEKVRDLMKRIELVEDDEMTKIYAEHRNRPHELEISLKRGETFVQRILDSPGSPEKPVSDAQLAGKFTDLASPVFPGEKVQNLIDMIMKLEDIQDITELMELM